MLKLDKPFPPPSYSEITFPFCEQYQQCSCCNASHVVALARSLQTHDTEPLSDGCQAMTAQLACKICDPEVGTGQKQQLCAQTCHRWYSRCQRDYFSYSSFSQQLVPCGTRQASAVCSTAEELADNAQSFCQQAGHSVMDSSSADGDIDCFDGRPPSVSQFPTCATPPRRQQYQTKPRNFPSVLYAFFVLSAFAALLLIGRRIASIIIRQPARSPASVPSSRNQSFPGKSRKLQD